MEKRVFPHCVFFKSWVFLEKANKIFSIWSEEIVACWDGEGGGRLLLSSEVYTWRVSRELRAGSTSTFYSCNPFENISRKSTVFVAEMCKQGVSTFWKKLLIFYLTSSQFLFWWMKYLPHNGRWGGSGVAVRWLYVDVCIYWRPHLINILFSRLLGTKWHHLTWLPSLALTCCTSRNLQTKSSQFRAQLELKRVLL